MKTIKEAQQEFFRSKRRLCSKEFLKEIKELLK